jgi:hypothetical protein
MSKLAREKGAESPNSDIITLSHEEFKQRADKESFQDLTSEQWAELNDMSFALCAYFVWSENNETESQDESLCPSIIIKGTKFCMYTSGSMFRYNNSRYNDDDNRIIDLTFVRQAKDEPDKQVYLCTICGPPDSILFEVKDPEKLKEASNINKR